MQGREKLYFLFVLDLVREQKHHRITDVAALEIDSAPQFFDERFHAPGAVKSDHVESLKRFDDSRFTNHDVTSPCCAATRDKLAAKFPMV